MTIHRFVPTRYYTTLGSHDPVLTIASGDTVITTTVDARGADSTGRQVTDRGNPQTGPFFIAGAEPGDMLSVHLDRLLPNRRFGWSSTVIAPRVLDPQDVKHAPDEVIAKWEIDLERSNAILVDPLTRLGHLILPLRPMLGCFGVAPPEGQAISTSTASVHGGNMDYPGFTEGVTVHFPVFTPGALFHVGDGHALQGDGEIVGSGVEISFEVQFTVRVTKRKPIAWPRAESGEFIMAIGNARPLDHCVQHATSEMVRWLQEDYGLDARGAHVLLGQCAEYDVGNVFNPSYSVVCRLAKKIVDSFSI